MSRKSTIDNTKDHQGKMLVVLDSNNNGTATKVTNARGSSQKVVKQEGAFDSRGQVN